MNTQNFINRQLAIANELISAKKAFKAGTLSELGFRMALLGAKAIVSAETVGFAIDENGEETGELKELTEWEREAKAENIDMMLSDGVAHLNLYGSGSFLVNFVGEYIYYRYILPSAK